VFENLSLSPVHFVVGRYRIFILLPFKGGHSLYPNIINFSKFTGFQDRLTKISVKKSTKNFQNYLMTDK